MELFLFALLASLVDPIRWGICVLSTWFVPNYAGALVASVGVTVALSALWCVLPPGHRCSLGRLCRH